jgi:uncharacterized membrane protein YfcA
VTPAHIALLLVAGLAGGAVNGIAGGGTLISFPALLAVGLPPVVANVTNTVAIWPGYVSGAVTYRGQLRTGRAQLTGYSLAAAAGAVLGTVLLLTLPGSTFRSLVPYLVLGATALLAAQPWISKALARRRPDGHVRRAAPLLAAIFATAIYGAYFGGGLGILLMAVLSLGLEAEVQRLNGTKTLLALVVNTVALLGFVLFGHVDWPAAALIAPASFTGGILGARVAQRMNANVLRAAVVALGCGVGLRLLIR